MVGLGLDVSHKNPDFGFGVDGLGARLWVVRLTLSIGAMLRGPVCTTRLVFVLGGEPLVADDDDVFVEVLDRRDADVARFFVGEDAEDDALA